jgi:hypothetical protein
MDKQMVKILYIAGATRSGSTLLSRLLGEIDGFINVGEALRWLFNTLRMSRTTPCGCGLNVFECPFWDDIAPLVENTEEQAFATQYIRIRYFPLLLSPIKPQSFRTQWDKLIGQTGQLLGEIAAESGCEVIVDSSKNPANAYVVSQIPKAELYTLHLVRDPRGVVSSWSKPKGYLKAFPLSTVVWWWLSYNLSAEVLRFYSKGYLRIKYEDFLHDPQKSLVEIMSFMGGIQEDLKFMEGDSARIGIQHLLGGNPDKMSDENVVIRESNWYLPKLRRQVVSFLTLPFLIRYQYPI